MNKTLFGKACSFKESNFKFSDGSGWKATTLVEYAKDLEPFDLQLKALDISVKPFCIEDIRAVCLHMKRVELTNLEYPIIMDETGYIIDGWHRVVKALLAELETIKAVRFDEDPPFDFQPNER